MKAEDRALVFVQRLVHGHALAKALHCDFYRGSSDTSITDTTRLDMVRCWLAGDKYKIMVATDAFGPGNDYPHVRHVFFVGSPRGVVDFSQMAGRGGRDGGLAYVHTLLLEKESISSCKPGEKDVLGRDELRMVLNSPTRRCWREIFTEFLDGAAHRCQDSEYNWPCPACISKLPKTPLPWLKTVNGQDIITSPILPPASLILSTTEQSPQVGATRTRAPSTSIAESMSSSTPPLASGSAFESAAHTAKRYRQERDAKMDKLVEEVTECLAVLSGHCALCHISSASRTPIAKHARGVVGCPTMIGLLQRTNQDERRQKGDYIDWRKSLRYGGGSGVCYKCHIPYLHDRVHTATSEGKSTCKTGHDDMVASVVYWAYFTDSYRCGAEGHFGTDWASDEVFSGWLMMKEYGQELTNMIRMYMWVVKEWKRRQM